MYEIYMEMENRTRFVRSSQKSRCKMPISRGQWPLTGINWVSRRPRCCLAQYLSEVLNMDRTQHSISMILIYVQTVLRNRKKTTVQRLGFFLDGNPEFGMISVSDFFPRFHLYERFSKYCELHRKLNYSKLLKP